MRVGVDARHLGAGRGIARYLRGMLGAMAAEHPRDEWLALVPGGAQVEPLKGVRLVRTRASSRLLHGSAALTGRPRADRLLGGGLDVLWVPAVAPVAVSRGVPTVLTVHDRSFEARPGDFTAYERLWHLAARPRRQAARAAALVTISATERDELRRAGWPGAASARVASPAPGLPAGSSAPATDAGLRSGEPYLLFVGALEPRKGIELLAQAIGLARAAGLRAELRVAGSGRLAGVLGKAAGVRLLGAVADEQLERLYAGALALVLASQLEGFGLPPLEAALHGTPSVLSDLPVFTETLGDAALRVPAGDAQALAAALCTIEADGELRARLGVQARAQAQRYSWTAGAAVLYDVLREAAR